MLKALKENCQYANIMDIATSGKPCFADSQFQENIRVGKWGSRLRLKVDLITYICEGKIFAEQYHDVFDYVERIIRKQANEMPLNNVVKILLG